MCGIWLFLLKQTINNDSTLLKYMNELNLYNKFMKTINRGPDRSTFEVIHKPTNAILGFHRLSIMDPSTRGDQPFKLETDTRTIWSICNGEIYNHHELATKYNLHLTSGSDCEIIPHLYKSQGIDVLCKELDGEYSFTILDIDMKTGYGDIYICRDRFGIRPLFYTENNEYYNFSSEIKSIADNNSVKVFPPRNYMHLTNTNGSWNNLGFTYYYKIQKSILLTEETTSLEQIKEKIRTTFIESVKSRLSSDRPLGCLLSGGLDSSLVASIASQILKENGRQLQTFSIGMDGSTDEYYAKQVAKHIGSNHTHIKFEQEDFINALKNVIYVTETYDITTVRASTGQYLVSKWISENTDIKVLLIGDGSDELTAGYMYFHKAPSYEELHNENIRLLEDIHYYDVLRADRGIAENGLEARVPFLDHKFVDLYLSIDPKLRHPNTFKLEKWLLRDAFNTTDNKYLPSEVLFRKKEAFSDGVSSMKKSWYKIVQEYANELYTDEEFEKEQKRITHNCPPSKEALYFRKIWEENYSDPYVIPYFWLPKWCGNVNEPSARVLQVYNE